MKKLFKTVLAALALTLAVAAAPAVLAEADTTPPLVSIQRMSISSKNTVTSSVDSGLETAPGDWLKLYKGDQAPAIMFIAMDLGEDASGVASVEYLYTAAKYDAAALQSVTEGWVQVENGDRENIFRST